jgi:radical SAM protein with 4Fe4S-binding SPASM domain
MSEGPQKLNPYEEMVEKAFAEAIPLSCLFEITYRCNHVCSFCYNSPTGEREMTTEQIFEALRKVADAGILFVTLTGGEALCHKDFFEIAAEVRRRGMALRLYSNGYLLADREKVRKLESLSPTEVEISIHGARPETHDALTRIRGSFGKTVRAIEILREEGVKVNLKCPITRLNQNELFEVKKLAERLDCHISFDAVITPKDDGSLDPLALRPEDDFLEQYWAELYAELHAGKPPPRSEHCSADATAICGTGRSSFTIDPYGNILPCVALRRKVANILEINSLEEIWHSSPVLEEVRGLAVEARQRLDKQENGPYYTFCLGVAETQTGDPLAMYPQAEINAKAVRRYYDLLQIQEPETKANSA